MASNHFSLGYQVHFSTTLQILNDKIGPRALGGRYQPKREVGFLLKARTRCTLFFRTSRTSASHTYLVSNHFVFLRLPGYTLSLHPSRNISTSRSSCPGRRGEGRQGTGGWASVELVRTQQVDTCFAVKGFYSKYTLRGSRFWTIGYVTCT